MKSKEFEFRVRHLYCGMLRPTQPVGRGRVPAYTVAVSVLFATLLGIAACTRAKPIDPAVLRGVTLPTPLARPSFVLTNTDGTPFNFLPKTKGRLTFLFFGYTNCPDVCPVHMSNLASVLKTLEYHHRQNISVVFVTADPERDTPPKLRAWLDAFDLSFIGLSGTQTQVDSVQKMLGLAPAIFGPKDENGAYSVGHAGQVIVFQADDTARVVYPFGTRQTDWVHDLPVLLQTASSTGAQTTTHTP